ncbi:MAG: hypothetical protein OEU92_11005 [Alphaproteobacteria bacterium]|nr:hypothetical protein [Alphaproteobacteria bacterium]
MIGRISRLRLFFLAWLLGMAFGPASAQQDSVPEEPTLTVRITPQKPYLQQEIVQVIRVIAPHPFEELVLDLPPVQGAETITLQQPKTRKFETYGGEGYIYETSRSIFPKQSGELEIPAVRISGSIGVSRDERRLFVLREDAMVLDIRPPPTSFSDDWWLVARDVRIDEGWSKPLDALRVGDRITRSIEVTVAGATGAHLPELEQGRSTGLTVLPGRTERDTEITPGGVIGKISRSFEIRVDVDQPINISPVRVVWWNASTEIERRSVAPAVRLEPLPPDVEALVSEVMTEAAAAHDHSRKGILVIALGGSVLLIASAFWLFRAKRNVKPEDRRLRQALAEDGSPINAARALKAWAEASFPKESSITLEHLGRRLGPKAEQRIASLQAAVFGRSAEPIDARRLALDVLDIAQERRLDTATNALTGLMERLLGSSRHLPEIDRRPSR